MTAPCYEPRYLAGIVLFNRHDFFEAHDVWEELWGDCPGDDRRYYQSLIQAAVALLHFGNNNLAGAKKLFQSSQRYMAPYGPRYLGLDIDAFWKAMTACCEALLAGRAAELDLGLTPTIVLDPAPSAWPDPGEYLEKER